MEKSIYYYIKKQIEFIRKLPEDTYQNANIWKIKV